jgi:hypothetical protein
MPTLADLPLAPSTPLDDASLLRLSSHDRSASEARVERAEPRRPNKTVLLLAVTPALAAACLYAGARIAGVELLPSSPSGMAAEETSVVLVPGLGASNGASVDARELRSLQAAARVAAQTRTMTAAPGTSKGGGQQQEKEQQKSSEPPPPGGGTDESDPNLTLPIVGETPVPDPGLESPELPIDPEGTLRATGVTVPEADLTPPDTGSILP